MRVLLDTHALIWAGLRSVKLSTTARDVIGDPDTVRLVSAVSAYEIGYKRPFDNDLDRLPTDLGDLRDLLVFDWLSLDVKHAVRAARLPLLHRDPWDRLLVAQAQIEDLTIVSRDPALAAYGVSVLW